jgi:hypothetical protein
MKDHTIIHHEFINFDQGQFTTIPNSLIRDPNLRAEAKYYLILMLSNQTGWAINPVQMASCALNGISTVYSAISELKEAGYVGLFKHYHDDNVSYKYCASSRPMFLNLEKDKKGTMKMTWVEFQSRVKPPIMENPISENPITENPITENHYNKNNNSKEYQLNKNTNSPTQTLPPKGRAVRERKIGKAKQKQLDAFEKKAKRDAIFASLSQPMQSLVEITMRKGVVDELEPLLRQIEASVSADELKLLALLVELRAKNDRSVEFLSLSCGANLWKDFFKNLENAKAWAVKHPPTEEAPAKPDRSAEAREMLAKFEKDFTDTSDYDELDNLIEAAYPKRQFMLNHLMGNEVFYVFDKAKKYLAFLKSQRNSN